MCERAPLREWLMAYTRCGVVGQWCMHGLWTACMGRGWRGAWAQVYTDHVARVTTQLAPSWAPVFGCRANTAIRWTTQWPGLLKLG